MIDLKDNPVHTSEAEALSYWNNEFGLPEYYSSFDELVDVEMKLDELKSEKDRVEREINSRDINYINSHTINRAIELHFLVEMGIKYLDACAMIAGQVEDERESEYERDFTEYNDDNLFTRNYEED